SPSDRSIGLSVAEGNCVVERRGGEQPEANDQSINKTMMNSIRPDALASLLSKDEAKNGIPPEKGERKIRDLSLASTVSRKIEMHGVVGDRMVGSWSEMNQGSRAGKERRSWLLAGPHLGQNEAETFKNTFSQRALDKFGFIEAWARFPRPFGPTVRVYSAKTLRADCAGLFCQGPLGRLCGSILPRPFGLTKRVYSAKALRADC